MHPHAVSAGSSVVSCRSWSRIWRYTMLAFALLLFRGSPAGAETGAATVGQRIEFASAARGKPERIWGFLSVPAGPNRAWPLMLILHSSGGIHARDWFFARTLNAIGVATFVLDSFEPRGLHKVFEEKRAFGDDAQAIDAMSALAVLRKDPRLDLARLGAMGRSLGGQTAIRLSIQSSRTQARLNGPLLNLTLAVTPGCTSQPLDGRLTPGARVRLFLAENDAAPYQRCATYVEKMKSGGGDADFLLYRNAYHVFDGGDKPVWTPNQEVYAACANDRVAPNHSIRLDTGAALQTKPEFDAFFAGCVKRGMWVGGNPAATKQLDKDWTDVVRQRWLNDPR